MEFKTAGVAEMEFGCVYTTDARLALKYLNYDNKFTPGEIEKSIVGPIRHEIESNFLLDFTDKNEPVVSKNNLDSGCFTLTFIHSISSPVRSEQVMRLFSNKTIKNIILLPHENRDVIRLLVEIFFEAAMP
jgi:hypothetical protein